MNTKVTICIVVCLMTLTACKAIQRKMGLPVDVETGRYSIIQTSPTDSKHITLLLDSVTGSTWEMAEDEEGLREWYPLATSNRSLTKLRLMALEKEINKISLELALDDLEKQYPDIRQHSDQIQKQIASNNYWKQALEKLNDQNGDQKMYTLLFEKIYLQLLKENKKSQ